LYHHINNNHILLNDQFGFRHASSTDIASYTLTTNILTALNNKLLDGGIFCNLHKAFDCVNHDSLLCKMEFYGISGKANNLTFWHRNYFFLILAHPIYKMWIIQEPNRLDLWNKLHFEEEKTESIYHVQNIQYLYLLNKYIKCNV